MKLSKKKKSLGIGRHLARATLGIFLVFAGVAHLTFGRRAFRAQVPNWLPVAKDDAVVWSGYVEILLGLLILFRGHRSPWVPWFVAAFFVAIFPGNWAQYTNQRSAFGLNSNSARLTRLFFQPVLIWLALWSMGAIHVANSNKQPLLK